MIRPRWYRRCWLAIKSAWHIYQIGRVPEECLWGSQPGTQVHPSLGSSPELVLPRPRVRVSELTPEDRRREALRAESRMARIPARTRHKPATDSSKGQAHGQ
jgi:hypothetical protein